jgi:uncharacterized protein YecE (DUF72 family)
MATLRIGTCSWKYDSWKGLVYSSAKPANFLEEYSRKYNTVEIDQWFWSLYDPNKPILPNPKTVDEYSNSVPDDFKFTVKIPNSITLTHLYERDASGTLIPNPWFLNRDLFSKFLESIQPLKHKLGPLMFQFEYLNKQKMSSQQVFLERFASFVKNVDRTFEYAIEIRNPYYLNKSYFDFLRKNDLRMVFLQGYFMPPVWDLFSKFKDIIEKTVVIRLHGTERKEIEEKTGSNWSKIMTPRDSELQKVFEMVQELKINEVGTYINVNNHYEGSAPLTIQKLESFSN